MANPSDLIPSQLKPAWVDADGNLKPSLTRSSYSGGTPTAASDLKPSLLKPDGTLKNSLLNAAGTLKPAVMLSLLLLANFRVDSTLTTVDSTTPTADTTRIEE